MYFSLLHFFSRFLTLLRFTMLILRVQIICGIQQAAVSLFLYFYLYLFSLSSCDERRISIKRLTTKPKSDEDTSFSYLWMCVGASRVAHLNFNDDDSTLLNQ